MLAEAGKKTKKEEKKENDVLFT